MKSSPLSPDNTPRTSAYYAVAPFIGVLFSLIIFREVPGLLFIATLALMGIGAWLSSQDKPLHEVFLFKKR